MSEVAELYHTRKGRMLLGSIEDALESRALKVWRNKVNLILTSPPFPLSTPKAYGNRTGGEYLKWLAELAPKFAGLLAPDGSLVIEIGNAWEKGKPIMSTLPIEALLAVKQGGEFNLCQQFVCHNPTRLPGPAEWVNVRRIRVKDNYTHLWWMAKSEFPKADNRQVLTEYGPDMKKLLETREYNAGRRPSGHVIGEDTFFKDNGGAIPGNVLRYANTPWNSEYVAYCRAHGLKRHPARMQPGLVEFFVEFLTDEGDMILDPFAGSNTTGGVAERLGRQWRSVERDPDFAEGSKARFPALIGGIA
jgi:site-specific DNA-methyltransferase (cytosine-N4-specific)